MSFSREHELHQRRRGRNVGVALLLVSLIGIVLGLTVVKVTSGGFEAVVTGEDY
ncbi:cytochrome C oxidase assembly protein [Primorskyibacter sp. S187A]|uniref:cytochrome C oxidase assembly protein n=1 Tax=Primorskyibacter sp. S187A TaxID=3415130 RepID=UPI003C7B6EF8